MNGNGSLNNMTVLSTGGAVSSRTFGTDMMESVLMDMPSNERLHVRKLVRTIDEQTGMGYYAAMDFVANLGLFLTETSTNSPKDSTLV